MPASHALPRWAIAAVVVLATFGCDQSTTPVSPRPAPTVATKEQLVQTQVSSGSWNYLTAQVAISAEGGYAGFDRPDAYRSAVYTVERTLGADGVWSTVMYVEPQQPFGPPPTDAFYDADIARIETNDRHTYTRIYDRSGVELGGFVDQSSTIPTTGNQIVPAGAAPMPTWPTISPVSPPDTTPSCGTQIICTPAAQSLAAAAPNDNVSAPATTDHSRDWVDAYVVTPDSRGRIRARLEHRLGASKEKVRGLDRFTKWTNDQLTEVLLDPVTGAVMEENHAVGGVLRSHVTHAYSQIEPGVFLRRATRIELAAQRPADAPRAMQVTISNFRVGQLTKGGAR